MGFGTPPAIEPITVHTFEINDSFDEDESVIGGAVTINGFVFMILQSDTQLDDDGKMVAAYINNYECGITLRADGDLTCLMAGKNAAGTDSIGFVDQIQDNVIDVPHTSFNLKAYGVAQVVHRTIKVVVLNYA